MPLRSLAPVVARLGVGLVVAVAAPASLADPPSTVPTADPAAPQKAVEGKPIVHRALDGLFDDWTVRDPVATRRDGASDAANGAADLITVSLASDPRGFWIELEFANEVSLQGLDRPLTLFVDANGPKLGAQGGYLPGADFVIIFSPTEKERPATGARRNGPQRSKEHGEGMVVRTVNTDGSFGEVINPTSIGLGMAPAHASRLFEIRLDRTDANFADLAAAVRAMCLTADSAGRVELSEDVEITRALLVPRLKDPAPKAEASALDRAPESTLRIVSWNAEQGALFKDPEPFAATLKAIQPDVVFWQELGKDPTAESLAAWMNERVGSDGSPWTAVVSGGELRTAVVARRPLAVAPFLDGLKRPAEKGDRPVRVAGALLDVGGSKLLLASLHLKCCGRLDSSEDETRIAEAKAIHDAIREAEAKLKDAGTPLAGVAIGGDFNLVGARTPVSAIGTAIDLDGSDLDPAMPFQFDGISNATWRSSGNDFLPGRLDWILSSGSSLTPAKAFVFSAEDLSPAAITALKLPPSALKEPSDHQPVVVDFHLTAPAPPHPSTK